MDDPWIDVRCGAEVRQVGLLALFEHAHALDDLAVPIAPAASAILRVLVSLTAQLTGLDDPDLTADQWNTRRRQLLSIGRFDADIIRGHFDPRRHLFAVFDSMRPWLQDPRLATECPYPTGINSLVLGRPAGNNLAWFSPHHDLDPKPLPTGQALQHLLVHRYFGRSGMITPRTVGAAKPAHQARGGPLRGTVSFHPLGRTLFETLLAGVPKYTGDLQAEPDRPAWEEEELRDPNGPLPEVTWPHQQLTGRTSHAILLVPADDGATVTDAYLTWGTPHPQLPATDPYLITHIVPDRTVGRRRSHRHADKDRAWWRELDALLLAPDETARHRRPEIFDTLNDLPEPLRSQLRVRVHGFDQEARVINYQWYTALTPPLLPWAQENDPERAHRIAACCQAVELVAWRLTRVAEQAWQQSTGSASKARLSKSRATGPEHAPPAKCAPWTLDAWTSYWQLAEQTFWRLLNQHDPAHPLPADTEAAEPPGQATLTAHATAAVAADRADPAQVATATFTRDAIHALRAATAPARARHSAASAAVAHATQALRLAAAPRARQKGRT